MDGKSRSLLGVPASIERPLAKSDSGGWGSDVIAELLRATGIPYVTLNPGASYRGLHDSLVNHLGNRSPQMLVCLHEEHAVAIAHGWAKVTGQPLAVIVHSNVGLMHASMAVYNAWCDRVPLVLLGATGPVDAAKRRPWIDWIHTSKDQAAIIRHYTKWDDQPGSIPAAIESILRGWQIANTYPHGPVYICLDAALQEMAIDKVPPTPDIRRFAAPAPDLPSHALASQAAALLAQAERPLIMMGRVSRSEADWSARIHLAERLGAVVLTDMKVAAAFPSDHPLHGPLMSAHASAQHCEVIRQADVVLALDWVDLAGTLKTAWGDEPPASKIIQVSLDRYLHNGWSMDHQGLPPVDLHILAAPDAAVAAMNEALRGRKDAFEQSWRARQPQPVPPVAEPRVKAAITVPGLAEALQRVAAMRRICLVRHPLSWNGTFWAVRHPLDFLGGDGGGGLGSGPGTTIGSALALKGSGRLPVAVLGDGDFLMGAAAIWTAVHYEIPLLILVANNRSYYNDEVHQERVATIRDRHVENKWIGLRISGPDVDIAMMARSQGAVGFGPIKNQDELEAILPQALLQVEDGKTVVVDAHVEP